MSFGLVFTLMLILSGFTLYSMFGIDRATDIQNEWRTQKLERLYVAREALTQTGLAARNAYFFEDDIDAKAELEILDRQKAVYLEELEARTPLFKGDEQFEKARKDLLAMAEELKRPRQYRESGRLQEYGVFLVKECSPLRRQIVKDIDLLIKSVQKSVEVETEHVDGMLAQAQTITVVMSFLVVVLAIGIGTVLTKGLLGQLGGEPDEVSAIASNRAGRSGDGHQAPAER